MIDGSSDAGRMIDGGRPRVGPSDDGAAPLLPVPFVALAAARRRARRALFRSVAGGAVAAIAVGALLVGQEGEVCRALQALADC